MLVLPDVRLDSELLARFNFDQARWTEQCERLRAGKLPPESILLRAPISPAQGILPVEFDGRGTEQRCRTLGREALAAGAVAVLVLNGGLATRFGGGFKGAVEVFAGKSFLELKAEDVRRVGEDVGKAPPFIIMNSFATAELTRELLRLRGHFGLSPAYVHLLDQSISIRLTPSGDVFIGPDGAPRYYAPGHGDLFAVLRRSGLLDQLRASGVRYLQFSNIDNLGATVDPLMLGMHVESGHDMTVEVTEKQRSALGTWDVGGAPALVDERLRVVEGFRFPPEFPQEQLSDIQTNNMVFSLDSLVDPIEMEYFRVDKVTDGLASVTFEAITCEATGVLRSDGSPRLSVQVLRVPRSGVRGRFFPVKSRADLDAQRRELEQRLHGGWGLREQGLRTERR